FGALDYLLKPIEPVRLARAIERLQEPPAPAEAAGGEPGRSTKPSHEILADSDQVFLKDGDRCWLVKVGDIRLLESEGNYARVYFAENRPLIPRSLQTLEMRLDPRLFFRVSRQHIINLRAVSKVEPWFDGGLLLRMGERDPEVKVARRRAHELRERLSL
ncbi:MAG: LytR/AlgR family response regulator transcription factor, partial [Chthoniobacterales bacterium]